MHNCIKHDEQGKIMTVATEQQTGLALYQSQSGNFIQAGHAALSSATRRAYERDLSQFFRLVKKDIRELTIRDIPRYIQQLEKQGYRSSTINRKLYALSKVCNLYQLAGEIKANPVRELAKVKRLSRPVSKQANVPLSLSDVTAVVAAGTRTSLIVAALANTGLRVSELIAIKHADIEAHENFYRVRIVGKGKKERFVFLPADLYERIRQVFAASEYLFCSQSGRPLNRQNVYRQIQKAFRAHTGKSAHPHMLRHFFATHKIHTERQDVKAVSRYLGHSTTAITLDMYVDTALTAEKAIVLHNFTYAVSSKPSQRGK
jgi:site-specific recombinase XerD